MSYSSTLRDISLYLLRHGHRDRVSESLSQDGRKQASDLVRTLSDSKPSILLSSPKTRCRQTLENLAGATGKTVEIEPLLDEQNPSETTEAFIERISTFESYLKTLPKKSVVIACSHGDWIPEFGDDYLGTSLRPDFAQGWWIDLKRGKWNLRETYFGA